MTIEMRTELAYCVALKPVSFLRASEIVDEGDVCRLAVAIRNAGDWTTPIPIEKESGIVMDGNHRLRAAAVLEGSPAATGIDLMMMGAIWGPWITRS